MISEPAITAAPLNAGRAPDDGVVIRRVASFDEYRECVTIQRETWGDDFRECVPVTMLMVAQKLGGVVAGAFDRDGAMLGFVFGMAGTMDGRPVHWSDMLAVRSAARGARVGERLKHCQREMARAAGAVAMYWTFDPLIARNAHLNLMRLGARIVEYVPNMYGDDTGSPLHAGLPTDRLIARWDLAPNDGVPADGVPANVARGDGVPRTTPALGTAPVAPAITAWSDLPTVRITVPRDFHELPPARRAYWRTTTRAAFLSCFERGYRVTAFHRAAADQLPYYELAAAQRPPSESAP